jgi:hypothetical protein
MTEQEREDWNTILYEACYTRDKRIALLEAVAEAAIAAHEVDAHARKNQATHWKNYAIDALANALRAAGYLKEQDHSNQQVPS